MKVVFAGYDSPHDIGGVSTWMQRLMPALVKAGVELEVHLMAQEARPGVNCAFYEKHGIHVKWVPWEKDTHKAVRQCLRLIEKSRPGIYVANGILPSLYAAGIVRDQGVKTVGVLHSDEAYYHGIIEEFVCGSPRFALSAIVAVSQYLEQSVLKRGSKRNTLVRGIGYGVPVPRSVAKIPNGVLRLVYTGRLVEEQKRISAVTRSLCAVVKQNEGVEAWIVGDGDARAEVERIILANQIAPGRIQLLGRLSPEKVQTTLQDCHVSVLLSDYEGLPVSMLEAMAAGVVPICLDMRSGIREAIDSGRNGLIVQDRQAAFEEAVKSLRQDTALWTKLSLEARSTVVNKFSAERCAEAWLNLLKELGEGNTHPIHVPFALRLPPRNPNFGDFDQRFSWMRKCRDRIHSKLVTTSRTRWGKKVRDSVWRAQEWVLLKRWMRNQERLGSMVHPTVEILGRAKAFQAIETPGNLTLEREVSLYVHTSEKARLILGSRVYVGRNTNIAAYAPITIGASSMIGPYCHINSCNHAMSRRDVPMQEQGLIMNPIQIGEDVWIGTHVVILAGVKIGRGAVIAAGAVVNCDVPEYEIWGGVPARFLKKRP